MTIAIFVVTILCLSVHHYLNYYWVKQALPYSFGFGFFIKIEWLMILMNAIYLLGWLYGFVTFVVLFFGGGIITFPLVFLWHSLTSESEVREAFLGERPNLLLYCGWSILVLALGVLTIINFFVSPYKYGVSCVATIFQNTSSSTRIILASIAGTFIYLMIGIFKVLNDYSQRITDRPFYAIQRDIPVTIATIFLWPIVIISRLIIRKSRGRRFDRWNSK